MGLLMRLDFGALGQLAPGAGALGCLDISREEALTHRRDRYTYTASFTSPDWEEHGLPAQAEVTFKAKYSEGALNLVATAIRKLLKENPQLKSGRYGVPRNRVKCRKCGTVLWSKFRHDFTRCRCKAIAIDGGYDYRKVCGNMRDVIPIPEPWQVPPKKKKGKRRG